MQCSRFHYLQWLCARLGKRSGASIFVAMVGAPVMPFTWLMTFCMVSVLKMALA